MNHEAAFLQYLQRNPCDVTARLAFADWLEERGDPRGELLRLQHALTREANRPDRPLLETRLRELWKSAVEPIGPFLEAPIVEGISITLVYLPPGTFMMGSPSRELERFSDEPLHQVTLTKPFYLGIHPVTQEQWQAVMGNNPSHFTGTEHLPVENVSWVECVAFCRKLSELSKRTFTLPTEAEWEYACRAGTSSRFFFGEAVSRALANYDGYYLDASGQYRSQTSPTGRFRANAWGLYDMHGNVKEWCWDFYGDYDALPGTTDPLQLREQSKDYRVLRGGSWAKSYTSCRSACRGKGSPDFGANYIGFRVCLRPDNEQPFVAGG